MIIMILVQWEMILHHTPQATLEFLFDILFDENDGSVYFKKRLQLERVAR